MQSLIRAALFVPATRPERFAKALAAGAEAVIIDLEDAVEHPLKDQARENLRQFALANPEARFLVRINDATTSWFEQDLVVCAALPSVQGIVLPKAESAQQIKRVADTGKAVLPIVESSRGVLALNEIAAAPGVERLSFGSLDMMLETGTTPDTVGASIFLDHIRSQVLLFSAAHGLQAPLDGVYPNFSDLEGLAAIAGQVRDMGFGGMLCIHPKQIPVIQSAFAPTAADREWAQRVVDTAESTGSLAFQLDGKMVDAPVIERARRILAGA
ncbi:putative citrate lyase beta subunit [Pusillimonas sp. T7-7]|uniref:HpcH/HpaI aldolase/citrate lyase family protein n=1 Tax=Pusillimonas sp. (strain T7-7) TaxID=1007105 RepID=UPI00020857AD|nr:putative citrate lyase beta subunit [Pusillimonas sp. T7-7]